MRRLIPMLFLLMLLASAANAELYPAYDDVSQRWGYIDETGAWAIAPQYAGAEHFHGGCAIVNMDADADVDGWSDCAGIIDENGDWLLAPKYTVSDFCDMNVGDIYFVADYGSEEGRMGFFNIPNRFFSGLRWAECIAFADTPYVLVSDGEDNRYTASGLADRETGEVVLPLEYSYAGLYDWGVEDGFAVGCRRDEDEVELVEIGVGKVQLPDGVYLESGTAVCEGLVAFTRAEDELMGYLNTSGEIVIPAQFWWAEEFMGGYANVRLSKGERGVIDRAGRVMLRSESEGASLLYQGMVGGLLQVQLEDGEWALLRPDGTFLCRHRWPGVWDVFLYELAPDGPLWALCGLSDEEYLWALVSRTGEVLMDPAWQNSGWGMFTDAQGWQAVGNEAGLWGYVDAYGRQVIPFQFAEARSFEGALARVRFDGEHEGYIDRNGSAVFTWTGSEDWW